MAGTEEIDDWSDTGCCLGGKLLFSVEPLLRREMNRISTLEPAASLPETAKSRDGRCRIFGAATRSPGSQEEEASINGR